MGSRDTRKVQTAVVGTARSRDPVQMPESRDEAVRFRAEYAHRSFWCGVWLGGCGKKLSTRVGEVRIPHFAHYPEFPERHVCLRRYTDSTSADHLYLTRDLEHWLAAQGQRTPEVDLRGDFAEGDTCRQAVLTTQRGHVSVEFRPGVPEEKGDHAWRTRLFGPRATPPPQTVKEQRYVLRVRLGEANGRYRTEIGTMTPTEETRWAPLEECVLTERGLTTSHMPAPEPTAERQERAAEVFGLPLDHHDLIAHPRRERSSGRHGVNSPKHPHRLAVYFQERQQGRRAGHLWLPEPVSGLVPGEPHRITGPAWADLDRSTPEQWSVRAQGLTPVDAKPPKPRPVPAPPQPVPPKPVPVPEAGLVPPVPDRSREPGAAEECPGKGKLTHIPDGLLERSSPPPQVLDWLSKNGWAGRKRSQDRRWIAFALMDENRVRQTQGPEAPHVRTLVVLRRLGERWLAACLLDFFDQGFIATGVAAQREWLGEAENVALTRIREWPQIRSHALVEKGGPPDPLERSRAWERVALQLLGVLALLGEQQAVRSLVDHVSTRRATPGWEERLQDQGVKEGYRVEFDDQRNPIFHITFTHKNGVRGEGAHSDKQVARKMAAKSYMSRTDVSFPSTKAVKGVVPRRADAQPITPQNYRRLPEEWRQALAGIHKALVPSGQGEGWVVQALTDVSWAQQNRSLLLASAQKDNGILAHQGSIVGHLLRTHRYSRRLLERTITPDEDEILFGDVPPEAWRRFLVEVGADRAILTGGEVDRPEVEQKAAKALLGACRRSRSWHSNLIDADFATFFDVRHLACDPISWLRRMNSLLGLTSRLKSAPAQEGSSFYDTSLVLEWRDRRAILQGPSVLPKVRPRVHSTLAKKTLNIAEKIRSADSWDLSESETSVAELLVMAQLSGPWEEPDARDRAYLVRRGHLGIDHLGRGDIDAFAAWVEQVDELHGHVGEDELARVARLYRTFLMSREPLPTPASRRMVRRLITLLDRDPTTPDEQQEARALVTALSSLARVLALPDQDVPTGHLLLAEAERTRPAVEVAFAGEGSQEGSRRVTARQAKALQELIARIRANDETSEVEVAQDESGVYVVISSVERGNDTEVAALVNLLSEVVPTLTVEADEDEYTVMVLAEEPAESLLQTGVQALRDSFRTPQPFAETLARLEVSLGVGDHRGRVLDEKALKELRARSLRWSSLW